MSKSPAAILYDESGQHPVGIVLDGAVYRLQSEALLRSGAKGTTPAANVTSENVDANRQALHVKVIGGGGGGADQNVRIVDGNGDPIDSEEETNPASPNGLMMGGWEESTNRIHRLAVDSQGRLLTVSAGKIGDMINLYYRNTIGAYVLNQFRRVIEYVVPTGYVAYLNRFSSWQNESALSRVATVTCFGSLNVPTNVFTPGSFYSSQQFATIIEAEVKTAFGSANNVTVTVSYTNEMGVSGRTGTFSVPKSSIVGTRFTLTLQAGDVGVRSVQSMSASPSGGAGVVNLCGFIQCVLHHDLSLTQGVYSDLAAGSIALSAGTIVVVEFSGNLVAKDRIFNTLLHLVTV